MQEKTKILAQGVLNLKPKEEKKEGQGEERYNLYNYSSIDGNTNTARFNYSFHLASYFTLEDQYTCSLLKQQRFLLSKHKFNHVQPSQCL